MGNQEVIGPFPTVRPTVGPKDVLRTVLKVPNQESSLSCAENHRVLCGGRGEERGAGGKRGFGNFPLELLTSYKDFVSPTSCVTCVQLVRILCTTSRGIGGRPDRTRDAVSVLNRRRVAVLRE